jgi:hypothetical protein
MAVNFNGGFQKGKLIDRNVFTVDEIVFLLTYLRDSTFKVKDIEILTLIITKLQDEYLRMTKNS